MPIFSIEMNVVNQLNFNDLIFTIQSLAMAFPWISNIKCWVIVNSIITSYLALSQQSETTVNTKPNCPRDQECWPESESNINPVGGHTMAESTTYYFASHENRDRFEASPEQFSAKSQGK